MIRLDLFVQMKYNKNLFIVRATVIDMPKLYWWVL